MKRICTFVAMVAMILLLCSCQKADEEEIHFGYITAFEQDVLTVKLCEYLTVENDEARINELGLDLEEIKMVEAIPLSSTMKGTFPLQRIPYLPFTTLVIYL